MAEPLHVVTGATSGIGRAIAAALAAASRRVVAVGRDVAILDALQREFPGHLVGRALDLRDAAAIDAFTAELEQAQVPVRGLVHCAGIHALARPSQTPAGVLDEMYAVNLRAAFLLTQQLVPALGRGQGQVVFVNSSAGLAAKPEVAAYSALQHAQRVLAQCWRDELNAQGIRVLNIHPGRTNTPRIAQLFAQEGRPYAPELLLQPEDIAAVVTLALTLPATVEWTDISLRPARKTY